MRWGAGGSWCATSTPPICATATVWLMSVNETFERFGKGDKPILRLRQDLIARLRRAPELAGLIRHNARDMTGWLNDTFLEGQTPLDIGTPPARMPEAAEVGARMRDWRETKGEEGLSMGTDDVRRRQGEGGMNETPAPDPEELKKRAIAALDGLQSALRDYRRATKSSPAFLRDHRAPRMRDDAFDDCRVFANRYRMMQQVATGSVGAEVGVQHGNFARFLLDRLQPAELHLFERFEELVRADVRTAPNVTLHVGDSSTRLKALPDAHFDWIYIDGDHSYRGARKDARVALDKVRPGGLLFFNDYTPWSIGEAKPYGVIPVVNELVNDGLDMVAIGLSPTGYFDVALRK